jgi:hypothetical protein
MLLRYSKLPRIAGGTTRDFAAIVVPTAFAAAVGFGLKWSSQSLWHFFWGSVSAGALGLTAACLLRLAPSRRFSPDESMNLP